MTVIDLRKEITINSPAGSGNTFFMELMDKNIYFRLRWVNHDPDLFDKNGINLYILRNPFDAIASGIEVNFRDFSEDEQDDYMKNLDFYLKDSVKYQLNTYNKFLNNAKINDYITPIGFRMLTERPDLLLDRLSKKFDLPFKENRVGPEDVKLKMNSVKNLKDRLPRDTSYLRKKIDLAVNAHDPVKDCYNNYIEYKSSIDLSL